MVEHGKKKKIQISIDLAMIGLLPLLMLSLFAIMISLMISGVMLSRYASEDKDEIVRPLANALAEKGVKVWHDEFEMMIGD